MRRQRVHSFQQKLFKNHHQATRADFALQCLTGYATQGVIGEAQLDVVKLELLLILPHQRILWFGENLDQRTFIELMQHSADRQTAHELRNQSIANQILRLHVRQRVGLTLRPGLYFGMEAE